MFCSLLFRLTAALLCLGATLVAGEEPAAPNFSPASDAVWLAVGPGNVVVTGDRERTAKLLDGDPSLRFLIACESFEMQRNREEAGVKLRCSQVILLQREDDHSNHLLVARAESLAYDASTGVLELIGGDENPVRIETRQGEHESLRLDAACVRIKLDGESYQLSIDAAKLMLESKLASPPVSSPAPTPVPQVGARPVEAIFFHAQWCGPCRNVVPLIARLREQGLPIRVVDIEADPFTTQRHRIEAIPAFVVVRDAVVVERLTGVQTESALRQALESACTGKPKRVSTEKPGMCCAGDCCPRDCCRTQCPHPPAIPAASVPTGDQRAAQQFRLIHQSSRITDGPADSDEEGPIRAYRPLWPEVFSPPESNRTKAGPGLFEWIRR